MVDIAPPICRHLFDEVSVSPFNNRVVFKSAADLSLYWKSHALFDAAIEEEFDRLAQRHFALNDSFVNTKGGVGVSAMAAA